jgi:hypothetical protein
MQASRSAKAHHRRGADADERPPAGPDPRRRWAARAARWSARQRAALRPGCDPPYAGASGPTRAADDPVAPLHELEAEQQRTGWPAEPGSRPSSNSRFGGVPIPALLVDLAPRVGGLASAEAGTLRPLSLCMESGSPRLARRRSPKRVARPRGDRLRRTLVTNREETGWRSRSSSKRSRRRGKSTTR